MHLHDLVQDSHDAVCGGGEVGFGRRVLGIACWAALEDVHEGFTALTDLRWTVRQEVETPGDGETGELQSDRYLGVVGRDLLVQLLMLLYRSFQLCRGRRQRPLGARLNPALHSGQELAGRTGDESDRWQVETGQIINRQVRTARYSGDE